MHNNWWTAILKYLSSYKKHQENLRILVFLLALHCQKKADNTTAAIAAAAPMIIPIITDREWTVGQLLSLWRSTVCGSTVATGGKS